VINDSRITFGAVETMELNTRNSELTECQKGLLSYWNSLCSNGQLPSRRALNPVQLGVALAQTSLVEKVDNAFRFRLTGSRIQGVFGKNPQERLIDEIDASIAEAGSSSMEIALETGRPVSGSRKVGARWHCWLRVPLLDDSGNRTLVLCLDEFPARDPSLVHDANVDDKLEEKIFA